MMTIKSFTFNPFQENTYLIFDETKECVVIDPGCFDKAEEDALAGFISDNKLTVKLLINTHCHIDHVFGNYFVKERFKTELIIHPIEEQNLRSVKLYAPAYGVYNFSETTPDKFIDEGEKIRFGNSELEVLFVPGHSPGHIALVNKEQKFCIGGDVLFRNSIGRTDLPGGNYNTLMNSIRDKMMALDDDVTVYTGHGPETQIGYERRKNPFLLNIC
jgi:hydroxyacylglutathione hydrolase